MVLMLRAIFGAAVVGDFLLAIALLALWNLSNRMRSNDFLLSLMEKACPDRDCPANQGTADAPESAAAFGEAANDGQ